MRKQTPEIWAKPLAETHNSIIGKNLANSFSRIYLQIMLVTPIESPEQVSKVEILAQKLVCMVCMVWLRLGHRSPPMSEHPSRASSTCTKQWLWAYGLESATMVTSIPSNSHSPPWLQRALPRLRGGCLGRPSWEGAAQATPLLPPRRPRRLERGAAPSRNNKYS